MFGENAVLIDVSQPAHGDDEFAGDNTTPGTVVWTGRAPCTLKRTRTLLGEAQAPQARLGRASARAGMASIVYLDELIVRTQTGVTESIVPGGQLTGYTVLVEDRRDPKNVTQARYTVHSTSLRAGLPAGASLSLVLGDGV